jgi:PAS domain S-box-containing protein
MSGSKIFTIRLVISLLVLFLCIFATFYFLVLFKEGVVYTHLFYIAVVLFSVWWLWRGVILASILVAFLLVCNILLAPDVSLLHNLLRSTIIIFISVLTSTIWERSEKAREKVKHYSEHLEELVEDRTKKLKESEERYRLLVEGSPTLEAIYQDDVLRYVNRAMCERLGWTYEEMTSPAFNLIEKIIPDRYQTLVKENSSKRLSGIKIPPYEINVKKRDGSEIPVIVHNQRILYLGKPAMEIILVDISERKRVEEVLRESEARHRGIVDSIQDGITIFERGNTVYVNDRACKIFGYPRKELLNMSELDLAAPEEKERLEAIMEKSRKTGIPQRELEFWIVRKDGTRCYIQNRYSFVQKADGTITRFTITTDITERKWEEEALRESEEKFRDLVERANDGIIILQGVLIKYANPRLAEMTGYTVEEAIDNPFTKYIHPDSLPMVNDYYKKRMAGEKVPPIYEATLKTKKNGKIDVEINAGLITYQGKPADLVIIRETTRRKSST